MARTATVLLLGLAAVIAVAITALAGVRPAASPPAADTTPVATFTQEQRDNAALIIAAGRDMGLSPRDQAIGVMTALGESSLRNIDYGDWETSGVTNPDGSRTTSIGLFQQQDSWGSREERLDPYTAATLFYRAMIVRVPDRDAVEPTLVAHRTQINRDPQHYARSWPLAVALFDDLSGTESGLLPQAP